MTMAADFAHGLMWFYRRFPIATFGHPWANRRRSAAAAALHRDPTDG
jgi:hypothetical protein